MPPDSSMRARVFAESAWRWGRSAIVTSAPAAARPRAMEAPMPLDAPVTIAMRPVRSMDVPAMSDSL